MLKPHKGYVISAAGFMVAAGLSSSLIATLLGKLTDLGFYSREAWIVAAAPVGLILISVLHGASMYLSNTLLAKASQSLLADLRRQLFAAMLRRSADASDAGAAGIWSSKFVFEANFALTNAAKSFVIFVRDVVQTAALTGLLFFHNALLALVSFAAAPLIALLLKTISRKMKDVMGRTQADLGALSVRVKEVCDHAARVKADGGYETENARFLDVSLRIRKVMLGMVRVTAAGAPVTQVIIMTGVAVVLAFAMWQTRSGVLTVGEFVTFLTALLLLMPPLKRLAGINAAVVFADVAAKSLFASIDILQEKDTGTIDISRSQGTVRFEHVSLRYPNQAHDALSDISFTAKKGDVVALVGSSGAGKSSLVSLIARFRDPTEGRITLDGIDLRDLRLAALRRQIAEVSQNVFLFNGTVKANILYGTPDATEEELARAVEDAALADFVSARPEGLDAPVGPGGEKLSGGERQRVAVARAFLKNAPILILDEATSALDSLSEEKVKTALRRLSAGRTVFLVAHRLSSIDAGARILVMEGGRIVEEGTRSELMRRNGRFAELVRIQAQKKEGGQ